MKEGLTSIVLKAVKDKQEEYYDEGGWKGFAKLIGMCLLEGLIDGILITATVSAVVSFGKIIFK